MHTKLNVPAFDAITAAMGLTTDYRRGKKLGVSHTTVTRARRGATVGQRFIAAATTSLKVPFDAIFKVVVS